MTTTKNIDNFEEWWKRQFARPEHKYFAEKAWFHLANIMNRKLAEAKASPPTDTVTITKAEYDALVADAERYRWLRDKAMSLVNSPTVVKAEPYDEWAIHTYLYKDDLDQAVDKAKGK